MRAFQKLIVGPSPGEKPQDTKAEVPMDIGIGSIVDAGRQSHGALQPGEARATFETPYRACVFQGNPVLQDSELTTEWDHIDGR